MRSRHVSVPFSSGQPMQRLAEKMLQQYCSYCFSPFFIRATNATSIPISVRLGLILSFSPFFIRATNATTARQTLYPLISLASRHFPYSLKTVIFSQNYFLHEKWHLLRKNRFHTLYTFTIIYPKPFFISTFFQTLPPHCIKYGQVS